MATKIILPRSVVLKCDKSINMKLNKSRGGEIQLDEFIFLHLLLKTERKIAKR